MSKRAEKAASAAYPFVKRKFVHPHGVTVFDGNYDRREAFQEGYQQAEKDLELTWQDIKDIHCAVEFFLTHTAWDDVYFPTDEALYTEALKRYNEQKNNSK